VEEMMGNALSNIENFADAFADYILESESLGKECGKVYSYVKNIVDIWELEWGLATICHKNFGLLRHYYYQRSISVKC